MITVEEQIAFKNKIINGLALAYERLLEFKKQKNSVVVVMRENKIVKLKPEDAKK